MSKSIFVSEQRHLVSYGNRAMVAAGLDLFTYPTGKRSKRKKLYYAGAPGQIVAFEYDPENFAVPQTVDNTTIGNVTGNLYIGVLVDQDGDGVADDVRLIAGEYLTRCNIDEVSIGRPSCGVAAIEAATVDCTKCEETYTVKVTIDDNRTRSWGPWNKTAAEFIASYVTECGSCDGCPADQNCREVICGLVDAMNNEIDIEIHGRLYPDWKGKGVERPYRAVVGHDNWFTYCFTGDAAACDCEDCIQIDAVTEATIGGETVTFVGNLDPNDSEKTLLPQLNNIAQQIEVGFDTHIGANSGFAVVTEGINNCTCGYMLTVVTCDPNFALTGHDACAPGLDIDMTFTTLSTCVDVDENGDCITPSAVDYTPSCWLAVIAAPEVPGCDCHPDRPWTWHGINVTLEFLKDPWKYDPIVKQKTILEPRAPRNFGHQVIFDEYKEGFPSGRGRKYSTGNYNRGWLNIPEKGAKVNNAITANCHKMYCRYYFGHTKTQRDELSNAVREFPFESSMNIPDTDTTTRASWELFFTALVEANNGLCRVINGVSCTPPVAPTPAPTTPAPTTPAPGTPAPTTPAPVTPAPTTPAPTTPAPVTPAPTTPAPTTPAPTTPSPTTPAPTTPAPTTPSPTP